LTNPAPDPRVKAFLIRAGKENVLASVVTIGEICKGIALLPESKKRQELRYWLDHVAPLVCGTFIARERGYRRALGDFERRTADAGKTDDDG
jgi:predicted nucleic acid-binding protein